MTKKKSKFDFRDLKKFLPYFATGVATILVAFLGSMNKHGDGTLLSLDSMSTSSYNVSVDQISGFYVVADVANAFRLASANDVASNYVVVTSLYNSGQTAEGKIEKPTIANIPVSRGVIEYTVKSGDSMDAIAASFGLTTDQIRWSNGLKTKDLNAGTLLYLPSKSGIVYTVKSGDTIESIVSKYGSTVAELIALNDLELSGISEGMRVVIKDGSLPETERPEYVPPVVRYTYSYSGIGSSRVDLVSLGYYYGLGGPYVPGQCTQYAWWKWQQIGREVPVSWGNARNWAARAAAAGYQVDNSPSAGAIFQTTSGYYGHVGYVEAVNPDGSILVTEMNYRGTYNVTQSTIPASAVGNFNYIH